MAQDGLLQTEALDLLPRAPVDSVEPTEEAIAAKYISGDIRIVTEQARTQLPQLPALLDSGQYKLKPDYQRRRRWTDAKRSRLIESFLMNVPVPPVFLYEFAYAQYEVMDGLQRLSTLSAFYRDEFALTELEYWRELEGLTYSRLPLQLRQGIDRRYLSSIVLLYETAATDEQAQRLKQLVFERINSGGVSLSYQESRNALSQGPLNEHLQMLARHPSFCRSWGIPEPDAAELASGIPRDEVLADLRYQSMEDVEMVLRFLAHRQRTGVGALRNMRTYLDRYWQKANEAFTPELVEELGGIFKRTMDLVFDVLGESAFYIRRERGSERLWVPRPTLLAYDSVMAAFSQHLQQASVLVDRKEAVRDRLSDLYDEHAADFDGRRTDPRDVAKRDELISQMLSDVVSGK